MNERIKELRKQAINFCLDKGSQGNLSEEVSEQFAQLIVRECANVAKLTDDANGTDYNSGRFWAGNDILTHFGVEE